MRNSFFKFSKSWLLYVFSKFFLKIEQLASHLSSLSSYILIIDSRRREVVLLMFFLEIFIRPRVSKL